ncbi:hypothetical protein EDC19_1939 [Natranaerovirga hydrolytica]|uniref:HPt (Histidine-containing phosphotransfer) domain-containing protein n=1 Tax=Natranaerovirga hydrolytica TaxID=680378 RepID=A0A4R1MNB0_9FIRM|nr:Hpt domain-containing protein [Natranaerovirga hydrolytica]TCK92784.1 hypothetical protein EDC19_1939 [Natranaerovirga hydrolytica]
MCHNKNYFSNIIEITDGDMEFVEEVANDLLEMFSEAHMEALESNIKHKEGAIVAKKAHKFRSAVVNFNMVKLEKILRELECFGKNNTLEKTNGIIDNIKFEIQQFKNTLEKFNK